MKIFVLPNSNTEWEPYDLVEHPADSFSARFAFTNSNEGLCILYGLNAKETTYHLTLHKKISKEEYTNLFKLGFPNVYKEETSW